LPQQRIILIIERSRPQQRIKLPEMEKRLAQALKRALEAAIGGTIVGVEEEDVPDSGSA
jgi:hypothetical protein